MINDATRKGVNLMTKNAATPVHDELELEADAEPTFSAKDLATAAGTDPKTFRRWLRDYTNGRANANGRWVFTEATGAALLEAYAARNAPAEAEELTSESE
jgi:hypothetical protein